MGKATWNERQRTLRASAGATGARDEHGSGADGDAHSVSRGGSDWPFENRLRSPDFDASANAGLLRGGYATGASSSGSSSRGSGRGSLSSVAGIPLRSARVKSAGASKARKTNLATAKSTKKKEA